MAGNKRSGMDGQATLYQDCVQQQQLQIYIPVFSRNSKRENTSFMDFRKYYKMAILRIRPDAYYYIYNIYSSR